MKEFVVRAGMKLAQVELLMAQQAMEACKGNRTAAAQLMGISVRSMYSRLKDIDEGKTGEEDRFSLPITH